MPKHKDLKRLIRGRMQKTGESYTTARLHILQKSNGILNGPTTKTPAAKALTVKVPSQEPPPNYAAITRMSDESVKKATGCTWERWVKALDRDEAFQMSHRELAAHIHQKDKTPSWWTQMVTAAHDRIRARRELAQTP